MRAFESERAGVSGSVTERSLFSRSGFTVLAQRDDNGNGDSASPPSTHATLPRGLPAGRGLLPSAGEFQLIPNFIYPSPSPPLDQSA